jgi:hypothetical protein
MGTASVRYLLLRGDFSHPDVKDDYPENENTAFCDDLPYQIDNALFRQTNTSQK